MHSICKCDQSLPLFDITILLVACAVCFGMGSGSWPDLSGVKELPSSCRHARKDTVAQKGQTQTNIRKHKPIWKAQTNLKKCEQISKNTNQFPETLPWSQRFSFTAKRISSDRQRNLWLPAMRISLSGYNRCLLLENLWHPGYGNTNQFPKTKIQERGWGKV